MLERHTRERQPREAESQKGIRSPLDLRVMIVRDEEGDSQPKNENPGLRALARLIAKQILSENDTARSR